MNSTRKIMALGFSFLLVACSAQHSEERVQYEPATAIQKEEAGKSAVKKDNHYIYSTAAAINLDPDKKFIRKVDMKFRVKAVEHATYEIENSIQKFDGYVSNTHLRTVVESSHNVEVAKDSLMEITYYNVINTMTLRVPNANLDTTLKEIANVIDFLDYRTIRANNVTLSLLSKQLEKKRNANYQKRLKDLNVQKSDKISKVQQVEREIFERQVEKDKALIEKLKLEDEIDFSTINLEIHQTLAYQLSLPVQNRVKSYEPGVLEIIGSEFHSGWEILLAFIYFIIKYWSIWLIMTGLFLLGRFIYRKYK